VGECGCGGLNGKEPLGPMVPRGEWKEEEVAVKMIEANLNWRLGCACFLFEQADTLLREVRNTERVLFLQQASIGSGKSPAIM